MKTNWNKFKEISNTCNKTYLTGTSLPFGGIRVESIDPNNKKHSLVLTRGEFIKYFSSGEYQYIFTTTGQSTDKSAKVWYEYEDLTLIKAQELEELRRRPLAKEI